MKGTVLSFKYLKLWSFWYFWRSLSSVFSDAFVSYCSVGNWILRCNIQHLQRDLQNWVLSGILWCLDLPYVSHIGDGSSPFFSSVTAPLNRRGMLLPICHETWRLPSKIWRLSKGSFANHHHRLWAWKGFHVPDVARGDTTPKTEMV